MFNLLIETLYFIILISSKNGAWREYAPLIAYTHMGGIYLYTPTMLDAPYVIQ